MSSSQVGHCSGEELRQTHRFLKIQLVTLHSRWHEYKSLFGHSKERVDLLNQCAGGFFHAVQFALLQQIELSIVRLLDPARQGYSNMNMTFSRLVQLAEAMFQENQTIHLYGKLQLAHDCSKRLKSRRNKAVAHLDVDAIQKEDQSVLEWPRIEEVDASLNALTGLANAYEQLAGLPIMIYDAADIRAGSEALVGHLDNSLRLKELVRDGFLSQELAYPTRFRSKNSQATR
ncbi:hypothetical protein [Synechococcus sp. CBW1108]|uniref:AbiU2 domain-containing protein n=1 Tax=Synechococcus sp. CBW1108 TaxID=1353147 RepID=UPI0018CF4E02|nr:hypothetical protein [Synechococcus sp. CBW1108]QPN70047.1 hypothetical protein H8F27_16750 [Synechococcus sp. CBW1108]